MYNTARSRRLNPIFTDLLWILDARAINNINNVRSKGAREK